MPSSAFNASSYRFCCISRALRLCHAASRIWMSSLSAASRIRVSARLNKWVASSSVRAHDSAEQPKADSLDCVRRFCLGCVLLHCFALLLSQEGDQHLQGKQEQNDSGQFVIKALRQKTGTQRTDDGADHAAYEHDNPETTNCYTKVDLAALRRCALSYSVGGDRL